MSRKPEETVTTTDLRRAEAGLRAGRVPKSKVGPERPLRELRSTKLIAGELHISNDERAAAGPADPAALLLVAA